MIRECKKHGLTKFTKAARPRCSKCGVDSVNKRRKKLKKLAVEYKGGSCKLCGYNKCLASLDFHHIDPTTKSFGIAAIGHTRSWEKLRVELDKCILICRNCHGELHNL